MSEYLLSLYIGFVWVVWYLFMHRKIIVISSNRPFIWIEWVEQKGRKDSEKYE